MRGFMFYGTHRRNDPIKLVDPRPLPRYTAEEASTGDAAKDGYTRLSIANPRSQGNAPPVEGVAGPSYSGPSMDWEQ